jgi:assimilatory nitrate reductase electron transfer subunit
MRTVVIGYGMAGSRFAAELRARYDAAKITVLGAEPHRAYNRILLSSLLAGKVTEDGIRIAEATAHTLDVRPGVAVATIDRHDKRVITAAGEVIEYDHLVLATGSRPIVPPLAGLPSQDRLPERVAVFRTIDDCRRILAAATVARTALVLGGGLLGLEAARGLAARGLGVQVVHGVSHLMERQLDPGASEVLVRTLDRLGISVHLEAMAAAVRTDGNGVNLDLGDGRELRGDLLVIACGVRPETGLATDAGLAVERGIVVDDQMRTSDPHIFAIGDCAEHDGVVGGLVAPAWDQARVTAQVLATHEGTDRYRPVPVVTRLKAAGIDLAAMGDPSGHDADAEDLTFSDPTRGTYVRLRISDGRLTSAIMLGDNPAIGTVVQLFDRGAAVPSDRRSLVLGRSFGPTSPGRADSPALMPDATTVCHCNAVSKGALVRGWRAGARSVPDVVAATRATTGCGTCCDVVEGIVDWLSTVDPMEVVH